MMINGFLNKLAQFMTRLSGVKSSVVVISAQNEMAKMYSCLVFFFFGGSLIAPSYKFGGASP